MYKEFLLLQGTKTKTYFVQYQSVNTPTAKIYKWKNDEPKVKDDKKS